MKLTFILLMLLFCLYGCAEKEPLTIGDLVEQCQKTNCDGFEQAVVDPE